MKIIKFLVSVMFFLFLQSCDDIKNEYSTEYQLKNLDEKSKLWLPQFLYKQDAFVKGITDVMQIHNLDTNESWGKLNYSSIFLGSSEQVQMSNLKERGVSLKMKKRLNKLGLKDSALLIIVADSDDYFFWDVFIDQDDGVVYFYGSLR